LWSFKEGERTEKVRLSLLSEGGKRCRDRGWRERAPVRFSPWKRSHRAEKRSGGRGAWAVLVPLVGNGYERKPPGSSKGADRK